MPATDLSAEIAALNTTAAAIQAKLDVAGSVTDPTQAGEFGMAILLLGGLGNVATLQAPAHPIDPEFPPQYNSDGREIDTFS